MKNIKPNRETCSIRVDKYILNMVKSSSGNQSSNTVESILRTRRGGA